MIICDTREKNWSHIENFFKEHSIPYKVEKLDVGDYFSTDSPNIVIDRKANINEVFINLSKGKENIIRFTHECQRARKENKRLIVLIQSEKLTSVDDVAKIERNYFSRYTGKYLVNEMFRLSVAYGVEWKFCKRKDYAKTILQLLGVEI